MEATPETTPVSAAIAHAPTATTIVRSAVATVEDVDATPALARTAVNPAKRADRQAKTIHMESTLDPLAPHVIRGAQPSAQARPGLVSTMPLFALYGRPRAGKPATILG